MKKLLFLLAFLPLFCLFSCSDDSSADSSNDKESAVDYSNIEANIDEKVKECFSLVNEFRTGSEAFYLNQDNTSTTSLVGKLGTLTLDEDLCKAAQIRAKEIVQEFSHTRPNGNDCFTVLDDLKIPSGATGENIAAGKSSGEKTFLQWKEDNENYAGQGHRRNMLGTQFKKIGIAYTYNANSTYKYYWAMILSD